MGGSTSEGSSGSLGKSSQIDAELRLGSVEVGAASSAHGGGTCGHPAPKTYGHPAPKSKLLDAELGLGSAELDAATAGKSEPQEAELGLGSAEVGAATHGSSSGEDGLGSAELDAATSGPSGRTYDGHSAGKSELLSLIHI